MVSPTGSISGILHVLVSKCYCNKLLGTSWLTPGIYYLTDLEVQSPKWVLGDQSQGVSRAEFLLGALEENPFPASTGCLWPRDLWPLLHLQSQQPRVFKSPPASGLCSQPHLSLSDLNFSSLFWLLRSLV